jgi:peptide/nickel transport system substrate-binding protein
MLKGDQRMSGSSTRRHFLKVAIASGGFGALTARAHSGQAAPAPITKAGDPKRGGTLTLAQSSSISEFSPARPGTRHSIYLRALFNTLVQYDERLNPQPDLAERWSVAPDGKSVTLKLREGVKFHSGREFTSADVKASWEFLITPEAAAVAVTMFKAITQIETPDKYTATLRFNTVYPGMFDVLDMLYIIDKDIIADRAKATNGTGPFRLDKYLPNDRVELAAFKDYWEKGRPYLDKVVIRIVPDVSALSINLEAGAIDCASTPTFTDLVRLKASDKYIVHMGAAGTNYHDLGINCKIEPFGDKRVRQAVSMCIDRERFCKTILRGLVNPTTLVWPSHSWAYFPDLEGKMGYNLEKAGALLKEAGLEKGFNTEILTAPTSNFGHDALPQIIQADLKKVGVNAKVVETDTSQRVARENKRDVVLLMHSYGRASRDPGTTLVGTKAYMSGKEGSYNNFDSPEYDRLRAELQSTLDQGKRKATIRKLQELILDECFTITVAESPLPWAFVKGLRDFSVTADNTPYLGNVWLDR